MKPELLLPAGSLEKMHTAYAFGADAVYAGLPRYSLRARNNEFRLKEIGEGIRYSKASGKKFYVTSNILPHNDKIRTFLRDLEPVVAMQPDAFIMADPGLIMMTKEKWPDQEIHLSVQANTLNYMAVEFWRRAGISRIILSRELSLDEIEKIRQECPDIELEVFVHGSLCIAYSGRCLLSGYFNKRDANQGTCTNSCRWDFKVYHNEEDSEQLIRLKHFELQQEAGQAPQAGQLTGRHPLADKTYLIEESTRPGQYMPIEEDEHGTYILNSKDLRAVEHVARLVQIGVDSLKVEGRTKSLYYVARVSQIYRRAIDDAFAGKAFNPALMGELENLANRGYTSGFLQRRAPQDYQNYNASTTTEARSQFVGKVLSVQNGIALVEVKNRFATGDKLEIIHPSGNMICELNTMQNVKGSTIDLAPGNGIKVRIPLEEKYEGALIARFL
jgi:putative protease